MKNKTEQAMNAFLEAICDEMGLIGTIRAETLQIMREITIQSFEQELQRANMARLVLADGEGCGNH